MTTDMQARVEAEKATLAMERLTIQPITQCEANAYIIEHHRHHGPVQGYKFAIAATNGERVVGVVTVGRPVARLLDDGFTAEVTRCCTDGTRNACSMLYSAAWRAARAMGYRRLITYTLASEGGASLRASNWRVIGETGGGTWNRPNRARVDKHPTQEKLLWEVKE